VCISVSAKDQLYIADTSHNLLTHNTTWANAYIVEHPEFVKVEKDEIRKDSHLFKDGEYNHKRGDEGIVIKERDRLITKALQNGKSVISSDTNLPKKHINQISAIAKQYNADVEVKSFLDVPIKELIERDSKREDSVGEQVIRRMFHEQVKTMPTFLKYDPGLEYIVICDLDGSLTNGPRDRSPYEWMKVGNDDINLGAAAILDGIKAIGLYEVFIFSGRDEVCRPETTAWLEKNDVEYDALFMRRSDHKDENGNQVKDTVVKAELIEKYIRGKYNILFWIDDRPVVVQMLKDVYGINTLARGDQRYLF
jgi:predicted kinase